MTSSPAHGLLVVVGAGASHGARTPRPPLGKDLLGYIRKLAERTKQAHLDRKFGKPLLDGDELQDLDNVLKQADTDSYENLVTRLLDQAEYPAADRRLRVLNRAVAAAMCGGSLYVSADDRENDPFKLKPDVYDSLISLLAQHGFTRSSTAFVSLNYDTLLEDALGRQTPDARATRKDSYAWDWLVLKPHGSIDLWGTSFIYRSGVPAAALSRDQLAFRDVIHNQPGEGLAYGQASQPVIAHYAPHKPSFVNAHALKPVRKETVRAGADCKSCVIIGVHIPEAFDEDPTLHELLTSLEGKAVLYLTGPGGEPDAQAAKARRFDTSTLGFEEGVKADKAIDDFLRRGRAT